MALLPPGNRPAAGARPGLAAMHFELVQALAARDPVRRRTETGNLPATRARLGLAALEFKLLPALARYPCHNSSPNRDLYGKKCSVENLAQPDEEKRMTGSNCGLGLVLRSETCPPWRALLRRVATDTNSRAVSEIGCLSPKFTRLGRVYPPMVGLPAYGGFTRP